MPRAERYIKKLKEKNLKAKIRNAIDEIQKNPYIGKMKKAILVLYMDLMYFTIKQTMKFHIKYILKNK